MRIVIDTSAMFSTDVTLALSDDPRPKIVPAVAFAERSRQLWRDRRISPEEVARVMAGYDWEIEPFGIEQAARIASRTSDDRLWARHSHDALIAGHVEDMDELWTANARDFIALGIERKRIVDITSPPIQGAFTADDP